MDREGWSPERQEACTSTKQHYKEAGLWREARHEREFWFHATLPKSMSDFTVVLPGEEGCIGQPEELRDHEYWRGVYTRKYLDMPDSWFEVMTDEEVRKAQWCPRCKERECECADDLVPPDSWPVENDEEMEE